MHLRLIISVILTIQCLPKHTHLSLFLAIFNVQWCEPVFALIPYGQMLDYDGKLARFVAFQLDLLCISPIIVRYVHAYALYACSYMYVYVLYVYIAISIGIPCMFYLFYIQQITILQHKLLNFTTNAPFLIFCTTISISILLHTKYCIIQKLLHAHTGYPSSTVSLFSAEFRDRH